jgi:hypothetical protein
MDCSIAFSYQRQYPGSPDDGSVVSSSFGLVSPTGMSNKSDDIFSSRSTMNFMQPYDNNNGFPQNQQCFDQPLPQHQQQQKMQQQQCFPFASPQSSSTFSSSGGDGASPYNAQNTKSRFGNQNDNTRYSDISAVYQQQPQTNVMNNSLNFSDDGGMNHSSPYNTSSYSPNYETPSPEYPAVTNNEITMNTCTQPQPLLSCTPDLNMLIKNEPMNMVEYEMQYNNSPNAFPGNDQYNIQQLGNQLNGQCYDQQYSMNTMNSNISNQNFLNSGVTQLTPNFPPPEGMENFEQINSQNGMCFNIKGSIQIDGSFYKMAPNQVQQMQYGNQYNQIRHNGEYAAELSLG